MSKRKTHIKRIIVLAVAIALILTVPFPFRIRVSNSGSRIYKDLSEKQITMTVDGWRWRSLTGHDKMVGKIEIKDPNNEIITYEFIGSPYGIPGIICGILSRYNPDSNRMTSASIYSNVEVDTFLISHRDIKECFDVMSADGTKNGKDLLEFFRTYIWVDF